jgi:hypothetical protein
MGTLNDAGAIWAQAPAPNPAECQHSTLGVEERPRNADHPGMAVQRKFNRAADRLSPGAARVALGPASGSGNRERTADEPA